MNCFILNRAKRALFMQILHSHR